MIFFQNEFSYKIRRAGVRRSRKEDCVSILRRIMIFLLLPGTSWKQCNFHSHSLKLKKKINFQYRKNFTQFYVKIELTAAILVCHILTFNHLSTEDQTPHEEVRAFSVEVLFTEPWKKN